MIRVLMVVLCLLSSLFAIEREPLLRNAASEIHPGIYSETKLESFESPPEEKGVAKASRNYEFEAELADEYPAAVYGSEKYYAFRFNGEGPGQGTFRFRTPVAISKHARELRLWAYGLHLPGTLHLLLEDTYGRVHLLKIGRLKYRGWRRLSVMVPDHIVQKDYNAGSPRTLKILGLSYRTGSPRPLKKKRLFFLDEMSATVRPKFLLTKP